MLRPVIELSQFVVNGTDERINVIGLTDEGDGGAAQVAGIAAGGNGGADTVDLAHILAQPLEQGRTEDGLQGGAIDLLTLQVAHGTILLEGQRDGGLLLVVGRTDELRVAVGNLTGRDHPRGVGLAGGQSADIGTDKGAHVLKVAVAHENERETGGGTVEAVVKRQHVGRLHLAVDDLVGHHAVGIITSADNPAKFAVEDARRRIGLRQIILTKFVDGETADSGIETGLHPA